MELTEQEAVDKTIEMWEDLAVTGSDSKYEWLRENDYPYICSCCFLCEFTHDKCSQCPFYLYLDCQCYDTPYEDWELTRRRQKTLRKKYAKQLLKELYKMRTIMKETNKE